MAALNDKLIPSIYNSSNDGDDSIVRKNSSVCPIVLLLLISNSLTLQLITISERQPSEEEERSLLCNQSHSMVIVDDCSILYNIRRPASRILQPSKLRPFHCLMHR